MDEIRIHDLETMCIVGIHPHERIQPQALIVNATLFLDTHDAARSGRIGRTVHYAEVAEQVAALLCFRRYRLLEVAATELCVMLLALHARLERVRLSVMKPAALSGLAKAASLSIERDRSLLAAGDSAASAISGPTADAAHVVHLWQSHEASLSVQTQPSGAALVAFEPTSDVGAAPSVGAGAGEHRSLAVAAPNGAAESRLRQFVWVLGGELRLGDHSLRAGQSWQRDVVRAEERLSVSTASARVFCCTTWCESPTSRREPETR